MLLDCFPLVLVLCCRNGRNDFSQDHLPGFVVLHESGNPPEHSQLQLVLASTYCKKGKIALISVLGARMVEVGLKMSIPGWTFFRSLWDILQIIIHLRSQVVSPGCTCSRCAGIKQPGAAFVQDKEIPAL